MPTTNIHPMLRAVSVLLLGLSLSPLPAHANDPSSKTTPLAEQYQAAQKEFNR